MLDADAFGLPSGVSIVVNTASFISWTASADEVLSTSVSLAVNAFKAALGEPSVKRFVFTSSSSAAVGIVDDHVTVTEESWNDSAVEAAYGPPSPMSAAFIYMASKVQAEKAVWKFYEETRSTRPDLIVNTGIVLIPPFPEKHSDVSALQSHADFVVLPNMVYGRSVDPVGQGFRSSSGAMAALWNGADDNPIFHTVKRKSKRKTP